MKVKFKESVPVLIIIYCLIIVPVILYKYSFYLATKIDDYTWEEVKKYLIDSKIYNKEPIVFKPGWLTNYASDWARFRNFNIVKYYNKNFNIYWLVLMDKKNIPENYQIIAVKEIKNLFIFKLKKIK